MPRPRLILILGDQLSTDLASLAEGDPARDRVVMAEVREEAGYVPHHRKKLAFLFSAMRHFAARLRRQGWRVDYYSLDQGLEDLCEAVLASARELDVGELLVTEPGEYRLREAMKRRWPQRLSLSVRLLEDRRFLCTAEAFRGWAAGRKQLRMEFFYREMRRHTGLLMEPDGEPVGGRWNFDADNRKRYNGGRPCRARCVSSRTPPPAGSSSRWRKPGRTGSATWSRSGSRSPKARPGTPLSISSTTPCPASAITRTP
ncbi:(6-4) photolyase [Alcanivorax sp. ALC70]|nr:(6-4) photolyase [Alcanivorax sp. ALC70]